MWTVSTSLARACGSPIPFRLDGDMTLLHPLTLGDLGIIENHLLEESLEVSAAFEAASLDEKGFLTEEQRRALADGCVVPLSKIRAFLRSVQGATMSLWLCLRCQRAWKQCAADIQGWKPEETSHFCLVRDTISGLNTLAEHEWPQLPRKTLDEMERLGTLQEMAAKPKQWKQGMSIAADMGKCNFADIPRMTIFQYQILTSTAKRLDGIAELPQGWNSPSRQSKQGGEMIAKEREKMRRELKNTGKKEILRVKGANKQVL
jgi:hypothetical protein